MVVLIQRLFKASVAFVSFHIKKVYTNFGLDYKSTKISFSFGNL